MTNSPLRHLSDALISFLKLESAGGLLLIASAALALIRNNAGLQDFYESIVYMPVEVRIGPMALGKALLLWINDGLMSIFFLLVGLGVKREILEGELSTPSQVVLPAAAPLGGMVFPGCSLASSQVCSESAGSFSRIPSSRGRILGTGGFRISRRFVSRHCLPGRQQRVLASWFCHGSIGGRSLEEPRGSSRAA